MPAKNFTVVSFVENLKNLKTQKDVQNKWRSLNAFQKKDVGNYLNQYFLEALEQKIFELSKQEIWLGNEMSCGYDWKKDFPECF